MTNIHCVVHFLAKNGKKVPLLECLKKLIPAAYNEEGCLGCSLTVEIDYSGSRGNKWDVCLTEKWRSREDYDLYRSKIEMAQFFEKTVQEMVEKYDIRFYRTRF